MMYTRWKLGAGMALLALGIWAVPVALSSFSAETRFSTAEPVNERNGAGFATNLIVEEATFSNVSDDRPLGSNGGSAFRLSMDGSVASVGGLGNSVGAYSGDYRITSGDDVISAGTFDVQATRSLLGRDVLLNATLSEQAGSGVLGGADGAITLTALSGNGSSFSGSVASGGSISSDPTGGGFRAVDDDELSCLALLAGLLCDHGQHELDLEEMLDDLNGGSGEDASPTVIPEPTSLALLGVLGAGAMVRRRGRRGGRAA